jgi:hypothetical protein
MVKYVEISIFLNDIVFTIRNYSSKDSNCNITESDEFKLRLYVKGMGYSQFKAVNIGRRI